MAQLDLVVGDLSANVARITKALASAEDAGADLCLFPELAITGYPPEDLLMKPRFVTDNLAALDEVAAATAGCAAVVGYVEVAAEGSASGEWSGDGGGTKPPASLANAAAICAGGSIVGIYRKREL